MVRQLFKPRFRVDLPIGWLSVTMEEIAVRCSLRPERYNEPGIGWGNGVVVQTDSGRMFALIAMDSLQERETQLEIIAEGKDILGLGVDVLLDEVVSSIGLSREQILARNHHAVDIARRSVTRK